MSLRAQNWAAFALIAAFLAVSVWSVRSLSLTADEAKHYRYGANILAGNAERFDDSKMPVSALNALPARLAGWLPEGALKVFLQKFIVARVMTMLFSALAAWVLFVWARRLYGGAAGLAALALYVFDPNILAHSQLVTTDIYAAGALLFFTFSLWQFARTRRLRDGLLCAAMLGFSLLAKYTSIVLLPLGLLALVLYDLPTLKAAGWRERWVYLRRWVLYGLMALVVSLALVNVGFLFNRSFLPFKAYSFRSALFQKIQQDVPALGNLPVPAPYPYLQGLDWVMEREQSGFGYGRIYLLGQLHENRGFPGYYIVAAFLKMPLATQVLFWLALAVYLLRREDTRFWQEEVFLFIPAAFFTLYFNFFYNAQIGLRFYMIVFPLLFVFTGSLFRTWEAFSARQKLGAAALYGYLLVSVFSYSPFFLTYFNELVWDRKTACHYLADSNLDWEQGKLYLRQYLAEHPQSDYAPQSQKPGTLVVSVNDLVGVTADPETFRWLRENFQPDDSIANEYLVYHISPQAFHQQCARTGFCK